MKMMIDMPLPIPRWVISSPSHMMSPVPAVRVSTTSAIRAGVMSTVNRSMVPVVLLPWLNKKTRPVDCRIASTIVT